MNIIYNSISIVYERHAVVICEAIVNVEPRARSCTACSDHKQLKLMEGAPMYYNYGPKTDSNHV